MQISFLFSFYLCGNIFFLSQFDFPFQCQLIFLCTNQLNSNCILSLKENRNCATHFLYNVSPCNSVVVTTATTTSCCSGLTLLFCYDEKTPLMKLQGNPTLKNTQCYFFKNLYFPKNFFCLRNSQGQML
jgi:hypothetical protein